MKKCPTCGLSFSDEHTYCLNDGTVLHASAETGQAPSYYSSGEMETQVLHNLPMPAPAPAKNADLSRWLFLIIGLMAAVIIALGAAVYFSRSSGDSDKQAAANARNFLAENTARNSSATQAPSPAGVDLTGEWKGELLYPWGTAYSAHLDLVDDKSGNVQGRLIWTFLRAEKRRAADKNTVETVRGVFNTATRSLSLDGSDEDEPGRSKIVDRYSLTLTEDGNNLNGFVQGGKTKWKLNLKRTDGK